MTMPGKKLQEIHDEAAAKLAEVGLSQRSLMQTAVCESLKSGETLVSDSGNKLDQSSHLYESEIQSVLSRIIKEIGKVINLEQSETERRLNSLTNNLTELSTRLANSITEFEHIQATTANLVSEEVRHASSQEFNSHAAELHIQESASSKTLKVQDTFVENTFQQKLDHALIEARGEEKQLTGRISKTFLQSVNTIDTQTSTWIEKLSQRFDAHTASLDSEFAEANTVLEEKLKTASLEANSLAETIQQKTHQFFEDNLSVFIDDESKQKASCLEQLNSRYLSESESLSHLDNMLIADMQSQSENSLQHLTEISDNLQAKVKLAIDSIIAECSQRNETNTRLRQELESSASALTDSIGQELKQLNTDFEQRLNLIVKASCEQLAKDYQESDSSISTSLANCHSQCEALSGSAHELIQAELAGLLNKVKEQQELALSELAAVVPGITPITATHSTDEAPQKSSRRRKTANHTKNETKGGDR